MSAGLIIRDYLEDNDISQKQLATALKISPRTMSGYLTGNRAIPEDVLIQIAQHLQLSTDYILGLTKNPHPAIGLSQKEFLLLTGFRTLTQNQKDLILLNINFMQGQTQN